MMPRPQRRLLAILWFAVLLIDLLALAALTQLRFNDGLERAFVSDSDRYRDYERLLGTFTQSSNDLIVLFRSQDFANPADLQRVADFSLEAQIAQGVAGVTSIFSLREPQGPEGPGAPLLPAVLPPQAELARIIDALGARSIDGARLVSRDRNLTMVVVALDPASGDPNLARAVIARLAALAGATIENSGMSFALTGVPAIRVESVSGLFRDAMVLNVIGLIIGNIVCFAALRSASLTLANGIPGAIALLWSLGALAMLGYEINVLTVALPLLVMVLSLSDSLHLTFETRRLFQGGMPLHVAGFESLKRVGPACALASITTAIAFAGLVVSKSELIRDFGIAGCIATMVSLVAVLIVHPLIFATMGWLLPKVAAAMCAPRALFPVFDWRALPAAALARPHLVTGAALAALVASAALYATIEPVYSIRENLSHTSEAGRALEEMNRELAPIDTIDIPVRLTVAAGGIDAASLARIEAVHRAAVVASDKSLVLSVATLVPPKDGESPAERAARLSGLLAQLPDNQRSRFLSADGTTALVRLYTPDRGAAANRDFVRRLEAALAGAGADAQRPSGLLVMSSFVSAEMISDLNFCFLVAIVMSGLLIVLWFRNLRYGLAALLPNILPIALVGAWLAFSGRGLQFSSGIALTIAFGIAVDDTVHILNRVKLNAPAGAPMDPEAIRLSMEEVTPVLVITTAVLSLGLASTYFSSIATTAFFGALCITVFLLSILADLAALPASLLLLHRKRRDRVAANGASNGGRASLAAIFTRKERRR